jgi:hypothetical protein
MYQEGRADSFALLIFYSLFLDLKKLYM